MMSQTIEVLLIAMNLARHHQTKMASTIMTFCHDKTKPVQVLLLQAQTNRFVLQKGKLRQMDWATKNI